MEGRLLSLVSRLTTPPAIGVRNSLVLPTRFLALALCNGRSNDAVALSASTARSPPLGFNPEFSASLAAAFSRAASSSPPRARVPVRVRPAPLRPRTTITASLPVVVVPHVVIVPHVAIVRISLAPNQSPLAPLAQSLVRSPSPVSPSTERASKTPNTPRTPTERARLLVLSSSFSLVRVDECIIRISHPSIPRMDGCMRGGVDAWYASDTWVSLMSYSITLYPMYVYV